ncbi:protein-glutamate O-methyltransferase CheR [Pseudomonas sp. MAFF212428]|uniref:Chemotaxis protein methyltransferase n=1 Tax=Pseudomonas brassicae TaxID=2708063 RepID=A0A6B3NNJ6_9PSED|nr:protein-glutamate O-methyltransferase CheR [Pseudomonas brassicae]NER60254.1 protein-glutamate O-methyltransferase CheR [Pseudomonas brassicae]NER62611.1 protein-glutamate O-methyltransferase CheR [Pseudomonas brassicae]
MPSTFKLPVLGEPEFRRLQALMSRASGIHLADNKRSLVAGRLMKRLRHHRVDSYSDYLHLIELPNHSRERRLVIDLLTTNETYFFREFAHFEFLGQWLERRRGPLRLWSAACSSGEEPYSMAMTVAEHASAGDWSILASDLSQSMLALAEQGIYDIAQARYFPQDWMHRHCLCGVGDMHGRMRVQAHLRARITLREINLVQALPEGLGPFDVIFLRNILIYFDTQEKQRIVQRLVSQLRPGGLLFIGHAESIHGFDLPLRLVHPSVFERT